MENFNVTCGISNLSINPGDEVGFAILNKTTSTTDENDKPSYGRSYHTYATDLFEPFLPPVYGKYDENGSIVEVKASLTTEVLEKLFHRPAEVVLNCIYSQSVYDDLGEIFTHYFAAEKTWDSTDRISRDILLALGFTKDEDTSGRYHFGDYALDIEENEDGTSKPGGLWYVLNSLETEVITHGDLSQPVGEVMDAFSKAADQFPGFDPNDYDVLKALRELSGMLFLKEAYDGLKVYTMKNSFNQIHFTNLEFTWDKIMKTLEKVEEEDVLSSDQSSMILKSVKRVLGENAFPASKFSMFKIYGYNYDVFEMSILTAMLASVNKIYLPTVSGLHDINNEASYVLDKVARKIETRRNKEVTFG